MATRNETLGLIDGATLKVQQQIHELERSQMAQVDNLKAQVQIVNHQVHDLLEHFHERENLRELITKTSEDVQSLKNKLIDEVDSDSEEGPSTQQKLEILRDNLDAVHARTEEFVDHFNELASVVERQEHDFEQYKSTSFGTHLCAAIGVSTWAAIGIMSWFSFFNKGLSLNSLP